MFDFTELNDGRLLVQCYLSDEVVNEIIDEYANLNQGDIMGITNNDIYSILEDVQCNTSYDVYADADHAVWYEDDKLHNCVGLTNAPIFVLPVYADDNVDIWDMDKTKVWWYPNYMLYQSVKWQGKIYKAGWIEHLLVYGAIIFDGETTVTAFRNQPKAHLMTGKV